MSNSDYVVKISNDDAWIYLDDKEVYCGDILGAFYFLANTLNVRIEYLD